MNLSHCIKKYISDENIKSLATVSTWLGNDHVHRAKIYEDKIIKDMKKFINALIYFIDQKVYELIARELVELIKKIFMKIWTL